MLKLRAFVGKKNSWPESLLNVVLSITRKLKCFYKKKTSWSKEWIWMSTTTWKVSQHPNCSSIYLSVCVSSRYRSFYLFTNQSIYLSIYLPIYLSTYPSLSLSIYLSIYPALYLLICLFTNIVNIYSVNCGSFGCHEFVLTFNPDVNWNLNHSTILKDLKLPWFLRLRAPIGWAAVPEDRKVHAVTR